MESNSLEILISSALKEDIGEGDHTTLACIPENTKGKAHLIINEEGILAGLEVAEKIYKIIDPDVNFKTILKDGSRVKKGDIAFNITGKVHSILKTERLVLNIIQRMSGIATQTDKFVSKLKGLKTRILDTRKTTPGMRLLEKEAVRIGGGENHRFGLYDMILIKDNHIDFAGGIKNAIIRTSEYLKKTGITIKVEIEARTIKDVKEIISTGMVDLIMLDNFSIQDTKEAVKIVRGKYKIESSGRINLENVRDYAECGVDYISVGALTHQFKSLDMSMKAVKY
ncbi:MAG: carboxylating nicotinate-nucleotide diphosphorylase [Bacteroidales bacterium]|nr:MAG: carboxylating nicotinate-nucleotide diphosphorylase [Bacteroidales bacterium]